MEHAVYRASLLRSLERMAKCMEELRVLPRLLDHGWFEEIRREIEVADLQDSFRSPRCPLYMLLKDDLAGLLDLERRLVALEGLVHVQPVFDAKLRERWVSRLLSPEGRCSCRDVAGFVTARIEPDDFESCPGPAGA